MKDEFTIEGQLSLFDLPKEEPKPKKDWTENFRSVVGCLGASNHAKGEREANDFYATDPIAIYELMKLETFSQNIWECACGQGHLAKPLIEAGYKVKCTDLIDRGFGQGGIDFLMTSEKWDGDIITNPPYKFAQEFIEHALDLVTDGNKVCMFLKVQFLEGQRRRKLFDNTPPRTIYISSTRINCYKNGTDFNSSMIAYAWYVWEKGFKGETTIKWFN